MATTKWNVSYHDFRPNNGGISEMSVDAKRKEKDRKRRKEAKKQRKKNK